MTALIPAATLLRQLPGRRVLVGVSEVGHLSATDLRSRCGVRITDDMRAFDDVDAAPPVRMCARCVTTLTRDDVRALQPQAHELAALHSRQARLVAQRCIDDLEEIRRRMRVDGVGTVLTTVVKATPLRNLLAPRPKTRAERNARQSGHIAVEETYSLAGLLNLLTPGGYAPGHQLYLIDPPPAGATVDPQARR